MKKILFITHALNVGGVTASLINLIKLLTECGYDISVACTSEKAELADKLPDGVHLTVRDEPKHPVLSKIRGIRHRYDSGCQTERMSPEKAYGYYVGHGKYDVEIAFFFGRPIKVLAGSPNKDSKKIIWIHSDYKKCTGYYMGFKNKDDAIAEYMRADVIACCSGDAAKSFTEVIGRSDNVKVIYNYIDAGEIRHLSLEEAVKIPDDGCFRIVTVGRMSEEKGYVRLARASVKLAGEGVAHRLTLVGDGPERSAIEKLIRDSGVTHITLAGKQKNPYPYIRAADLLVCSSYYEGYGIAVAEAMILETPVLSTRCTGPNEILEDGKYGMMADNNDESLYEGLKRMICDREMYLHYKEMTLKRSKFFSRENAVRQLESVLEK